MPTNRNLPPPQVLRFFRWYCDPSLADHIEGDLLEDYKVNCQTIGTFRAKAKFIFEVLLLCRPGIVRSPKRQNINSFVMYKSYFVIGWRNLLRNRAYSILNISGLALGMTVALLNGLWIWDELSFNRHFKNYDRIANLTEAGVDKGEEFRYSSMTYPLGLALIENYDAHYKRLSRASWRVDPILAAGDKMLKTSGMYVDASFPEIFSFEMLQGNIAALRTANTIVVSSSFAKSFFGYDDAIGKSVRINNAHDAVIAGVYQDFPANTMLAGVKFFGSWDLWLKENPWIEGRALSDWRNHFLQIYIELNEGTSIDEVGKKLSAALKFDPQDAEEAKTTRKRLTLFPMSQWHLYPLFRGHLSGTPVLMLKLVAAIGSFILCLACINFMNLSTARSEKRAKEVGIRKTIGSLRAQLITQFFSESFLIVAFAFIVALCLTYLVLPSFNVLSEKQIAMPWSESFFWMACLFFCLLTSALAGSYPALYLSSFNPVKTLKGKIRVGKSASLPRQILVVCQFSISVILIVCTVIVYQQVQYAKNRPIGFNPEGLLFVPKITNDFNNKYDLFRTELRNTGAVEEVSESMGFPTDVVSGNGGWDWKGRDPNFDESFVTHSVSHTHGKTIGWQFVSGKDFSLDNRADSSGLIINEAAAQILGLKDPVGEPVSWKWWVDGRVLNYTVIGVIKDPVMNSPYAPTEPSMFYLKGFNGKPDIINIRVNPNVSMSEALPRIEKVFKRLVPSAPFTYYFADDEYAAKFAFEEKIGTIALTFASLAIFISCLGLFGLASFVAEQRTKEIGIRKVLGATIANIWRMLSKEFVALVLIACLVSAPVSYFVMRDWLDSYIYRIEVSASPFIVTALGAIAITLLTVSFQSIRAALTNPVHSLRNE